jgi:hypothetical protein
MNFLRRLPAPPCFFISFAALALGACANIGQNLKDDRIFQRSQARLSRTLKEAAQSGATGPELALFSQAESFYEYRFGFPSRTGWGQSAQVLAVMTDFPALQSLAGAVDLLDRRLGTYDSAVQLWESSLGLYPESPLRALSLYRLGWAYRSIGAQGFEGSPGASFRQLRKEFPDSPLALLSLEADKVPWKSKGSATLYSLIPGAGQWYVGEQANGWVRFGIALAGLAAFAVPSLQAYQRREELSWAEDWPLAVLATGGLVVLSVDYTLAYQDAIRGVVQFNEKREDEFLEKHPGAP